MSNNVSAKTFPRLPQPLNRGIEEIVIFMINGCISYKTSLMNTKLREMNTKLRDFVKLKMLFLPM